MISPMVRPLLFILLAWISGRKDEMSPQRKGNATECQLPIEGCGHWEKRKIRAKELEVDKTKPTREKILG